MRPAFRRCIPFLLLAAACSPETATTPLSPDADPAFAKTPAGLPAGTLRLCKVAGTGITAGEEFTFDVALEGVLRSTVVAAGSCADLAVPRERSALSKGYFQNKEGDVLRLVPDGTGLVVDGALLSAGQLLDVLRAAPDVQASSPLILNLAQQLIAADLNVLRGVPAPADVMAALAEANAALIVSAGAAIEITSSLSTAQASALVSTLADFNEGRTKPPAPAASVDLAIAENVPALAEVTAIVCDPADRCSGADLATGAVTASVESGATTRVAYTNRARPVLRICKEVSEPLPTGVSYRFTAGGINVTDAASIDVDAGDCADTELKVGTYMVAESVPDQQAVSAIDCDPADRCTNKSLAVGQVHASVTYGITAVTFHNRTTVGTLTICKTVGAGLSTTTPFRFTAGGINLNDVAQLDVAHGECKDATLHEGSYLLTESVPAGAKMASVECDPADRCSSISLNAAALHATVVAGSTTTVNVVNLSSVGTLVVCKSVGPGVSTTAPFHFSAGGINLNDAAQFDVAAGNCQEASLTEGSYLFLEAPIPGTAVESFTCVPADRCTDISPAAAALHATVVGGSTTTINVLNRSTIGTLEVCVIGGPAMTYRFTAGGINVNQAYSIDVPGGGCIPTPVAVGTYMLSQAPVPGVATTAIVCDPSANCTNVSLQVATVHASIQPGATTRVTFTNEAAVAFLDVGAHVAARAGVPPDD